jgi:class 3 adenylate cyclase/tetratricopeptide (TPR) repeat protein
MSACPSCASAVPDRARFCPTCGHLLVLTEERRFVTVLFADLVGFTSLSEEKDPELVKHLIDRCFERLVADITSFGGTIDKIIGDAIVALFGAPKAHEDDPERAVRAGLRMQRSLDDVAHSSGVDIKMRIGITTGEVLVGAITAGGDYTAMGDTVNLASRLESMAAPGEVLVGRSTQEATAAAIEYEPRGRVEIRGRDDAVEVFAAVAELLPPGRRRRGFSAPMVGRNAEQMQLTTAIDNSIVRSRAHLVLLLGEAGMGKSRLSEEVAAAAESNHDALVLEGRVLPYGEPNPYRPIGEALATAFEVHPSDFEDAAAAKVSGAVAKLLGEPAESELVERVTRACLHIMGYDGSLAALDAVRRREEIQVGIRMLFDAAVQRRPVVLTLGDVNWANELLLSLIESLITALANKPLIVMATARWAVDEDRWVVPPGRHNTTVLNLDALDRNASARLVRSLLGVSISEQLADALYERSGGNPFFLEELTNMLREAGAEEGTRADLVDRLGELPDTLRGLVAARLDALNPDERAMVDNAAVIGRAGPVYALLTMAETRGREAPEHTFSQLVAKELLATEDDRWTFRSDLVRDISYNMLTKTVRAQTHMAIGNWLSDSANGVDRTTAGAGLIARHYAAVAHLSREMGRIEGVPDDVVDRALVWLSKAAEQAGASSSFLVAGKFYAQALELVAQDDARLIGLALGRARARLGLRELDGALEDADLARRVSFVRGDEAGIAAALMAKGEIETARGDHAEALRHLSAALRRWRDLGDHAGSAEALRLHGMASLTAGDRQHAEVDFTEALSLFVELDDSRGEAWCQQNLAWVAFEMGRMVEARLRLDRAIEIFGKNGDAGGMGWALGLAAFLHFHEGDSERALAIAERVLEEAIKRGDRFGEPMMQLLLSSISLWSGDCRRAVDQAMSALAVFRETESDYGVVQALGTLCRAHAALGRFAESRAAISEAIDLASAAEGRPQMDFVRMVEAGAAAQVGDARRALVLLDAITATSDDPRILGSMDRQVTRALALLQLGRPDDAQAVASAVVTGGRNDPGTYLSSTRALIAVVLGRVEEAIAIAAPSVESPKATYLDRRAGLLAIALAHTRAGRLVEMEAAFRAAIDMIDSTESRLSQAVVRLARAIAFEAVGHEDAAEHRVRVDRIMDSLEVSLDGWRDLFVAAVEPKSNVTAR